MRTTIAILAAAAAFSAQAVELTPAACNSYCSCTTTDEAVTWPWQINPPSLSVQIGGVWVASVGAPTVTSSGVGPLGHALRRVVIATGETGRMLRDR